jgi:hypothetical protein
VACVRKNFKVKLRNRRALVAELLYPLYFLGILVIQGAKERGTDRCREADSETLRQRREKL